MKKLFRFRNCFERRKGTCTIFDSKRENRGSVYKIKVAKSQKGEYRTIVARNEIRLNPAENRVREG